jgi:hypothetical protein
MLIMDLAAYSASVTGDAPPSGMAPPLAALWWAKKGQWEKAHRLVMADDSREAAWVHAHLHRVEGDAGNAGYWYRRAGQPVTKLALDAEWSAIVADLLAR